MQRSFSSSALVLRVRPSGESNREVSFLSAEEGIIGATLFGGPKSRLRSHVSPFNSGTLWIYRDPAKGFAKVSDFDVDSWRPGLRELYERGEAAFRIAGTILAGLGGGGAWPEALGLALPALDALESAAADFCERIVLQFLWRWAGFLGNRPPLGGCSFCGARVDIKGMDPETYTLPKQHTPSLQGGVVDCYAKGPYPALQGVIKGMDPETYTLPKQHTPSLQGGVVDSAGGDGLLWFIRGEGLLCGVCAARLGRGGLAVGPGARRWLAAVEKRPPPETARLGLDAASLAEVTAFTAALLET